MQTNQLRARPVTDALDHRVGYSFNPEVAAEDLTGRQRDVLILIGRGMSNAQIARHLILGENTVKTYTRQLYRQIGATGRTHAVIWCFRHGLADTACSNEDDGISTPRP